MTVLETGLFNVAWFMIAVPLVVAALLLVLGRRSDAWGHVLATVAPIVAFVIGLVPVSYTHLTLPTILRV